MSTQVTFTKARAQRFVTQIDRGLPLTPSGRNWTTDDLLQVCGASAAMAFSEMLKDRSYGHHKEYREAVASELHHDFNMIIKHLMLTTMMISTDKYDQHYDPRLVVVVHRRSIQEVFGARGQAIVQFNE